MMFTRVHILIPYVHLVTYSAMPIYPNLSIYQFRNINVPQLLFETLQIVYIIER